MMIYLLISEFHDKQKEIFTWRTIPKKIIQQSVRNVTEDNQTIRSEYRSYRYERLPQMNEQGLVRSRNSKKDRSRYCNSKG